MTRSWVLGADVCPAGWIGIAWSGDEVHAAVKPSIGDLVALAETLGDLEAIAIDIPIGLPDRQQRQADVLARQKAGPRRASVFTTPVRKALGADDYQGALRISRELTRSGISRQAFNLGRRIMEVDSWLPATHHRVVEAHPELSFAEMAGAPLADAKWTWAGAVRRRQLLLAAGIELSGDLNLTGMKAGIDDVLDAAAVAWTAARVARDTATCLPDPPQRFSDGIDAAIWT